MPFLGLITFITVIFLCHSAAEDPILRGFYREARSKGPLPVLRGGLWGYVNQRGTLVIAPRFDAADFFYEGRAAVRFNEKWGFIDEQGDVVIPLEFTSVGKFSSGLANVFIDAPVPKPRVYGYVDHSGEMVIHCNNSCMQPYSGNMRAAAVEIFRCVDETGRTVPKEYPCAPDATSNTHAVFVNRWGYYDSRGRLVVPGILNAGGGNFSEGVAAVQQFGERKFGFIDVTGTFVISPQFEGAQAFSEGLAAVQLARKWGFINHQGEFTIPAQFDEADSFSDGYAAVAINGRRGYINTSGNISIAPRFSFAASFSEGLAAVCCENGKTGYIDKTGAFAVPAIYPPGSRVAGPFSQGVALIATEGGAFYIDRTGRMIALAMEQSLGTVR